MFGITPNNINTFGSSLCIKPLNMVVYEMLVQIHQL